MSVWPHSNAPKPPIGVGAPQAVVVNAHDCSAVEFRRKCPYARIAGVGSMQASVRARGKLLPCVRYACPLFVRLELAVVQGAAAVAGNVEQLYAPVIGVGHCGPPVGQKRHAVGHIELAVSIAGIPELACMQAVRAQYLDSVSIPVRDQHEASVGIECDAVHARELSVTQAVGCSIRVLSNAEYRVVLKHAVVVVAVAGVQAKVLAADSGCVDQLHALAAVRRHRHRRAVGRDVNVVGPEQQVGQPTLEHAVQLAGEPIVRHAVRYSKGHAV